MTQLIPILFAINILLILVDAGLGYFVAPLMLRKMEDGEADTRETATVSVRRLLSMVVAFYMFFNCLAYFKSNTILLLIVTGVVVFDIVFQLIVRRKLHRRV